MGASLSCTRVIIEFTVEGVKVYLQELAALASWEIADLKTFQSPHLFKKRRWQMNVSAQIRLLLEDAEKLSVFLNSFTSSWILE